MKPYKAKVAVTTNYNVEVHEEDAVAVTDTIEKMDSVQITNAGDIIRGDESVEVLDVELMYSEDEEETASEEAVTEPDALQGPEQGFVDMNSLKGTEEAEEVEADDDRTIKA